MPAKWKVKEVEELAKKLKDSPVVAVVGIKGLPSKQMQEIRKKLKGQAEIRIVKNSLIRLAMEKSKREGIKQLEGNITDSTAVIFTKENPFKLCQALASSRVKMAAKPGSIAPDDIVVPAGDTPFKPGPIIGDLQTVGIKAKIQGPIIAVIQDSPVIKKGEKFSAKLASVLAQMEIFPMEIGIEIRAALEQGVVYAADVLSISTESVTADIITAHRNAINLAVEAMIFNKTSTPVLLEKGVRNARSVAAEAKLDMGEKLAEVKTEEAKTEKSA